VNFDIQYYRRNPFDPRIRISAVLIAQNDGGRLKRSISCNAISVNRERFRVVVEERRIVG